MKNLGHLKKFVITNIEKPNLIIDLICLVIYPKQTLSLGQQVCAPEGPAGARTWRASRCANLEGQQVRTPGGPAGARTCKPSRCAHMLGNLWGR